MKISLDNPDRKHRIESSQQGVNEMYEDDGIDALYEDRVMDGYEEETMDPEFDDENEEYYRDEYEYDDSMDGDHASALASAGWGTDEDYGGGYEDFGDY